MEDIAPIALAIPDTLANMQLPTPELLTYYRNLDSRTIWIDEEVSNLTLEVIRNIILWNAEDREIAVEDRIPIKLLFFSPGGSLYVNNAVIDVISTSTTPVHGYNIGMAFSSAAFIFLACHKRYALPHATFLLHKGSGSIDGIVADVKAAGDEYNRQIGELVDLVAECTNISRATANKKMNSDWYITAAEAHDKYGFVDEIITSLDRIG